jgi:hypothetical protein
MYIVSSAGKQLSMYNVVTKQVKEIVVNAAPLIDVEVALK